MPPIPASNPTSAASSGAAPHACPPVPMTPLTPRWLVGRATSCACARCGRTNSLFHRYLRDHAATCRRARTTRRRRSRGSASLRGSPGSAARRLAGAIPLGGHGLDRGPASAASAVAQSSVNSMEKRVLLAVVLSFVVLYGYQALFPPPKPAQEQTQPAPSAQPRRRGQAGRSGALRRRHLAPSTPPAVTAAAAPRRSWPTPPNATCSSRTSRCARSSPRGAAPSRAGELKKYHGAAGEPAGARAASTCRPAPCGRSRSRWTMRRPRATLHQALYQAEHDGDRAAPAPATLTFDYQDASGLTVHKEFAFSPDQPYIVDFTATRVAGTAASSCRRSSGARRLGTGIVASSTDLQPAAAADLLSRRQGHRASRTRRSQENAVAGRHVRVRRRRRSLLPHGGGSVGPAAPRAVPAARSCRLPGGDATAAAHFVDWSARYQAAPRQARFFLGPKDFDVLAAVDRDLVRAIDFGMFAWLVVPLLRALKWVNGYVGNYGWSIIVLTILINLVMFPLRHKSVVSMRKMQEIQPRGEGDPGSLREAEDDRSRRGRR